MNEQDSTAMETPGQTLVERPQVGWGFWVLSVAGLAAVGALSYCVGSLAPFAKFTLPPAAMMIFGFLAGGVHGFALRRQFPPALRWISASSVAGFLAAFAAVVSTFPAETLAGLLVGWAYAWVAYGAVFGIMLQRIVPRRWLALTSLVGWATAGIASGAVGWALDVFTVTETIPTQAFLDMPSRTWSMAGLAVMGAVCGATGGAITGAVLVLQSRLPQSRVRALPQDREVREAKDRRLTNIAGVISGLFAAILCIYTAPLVLTMLWEGSLDSLDLTIFFLSAIYGSPVCIPTIAVVAIPLGIAGGRVGLEIGSAIGKLDSRLWVWCGAALGGVAGYVLGYLVAFAIGNLYTGG